MNYLSNCNYHNESNHPKPGKLFLKHTKGNLSNLRIILLSPPFIYTFNRPIASVTINPDCSYKKTILVDFTGILTTQTILANNSILYSFTLFRIDNKHITPQALTRFDFYFINFSGASMNNTLKFQYSPCDNECYTCCTYILELTRISSIAAIGVDMSINGTLHVLTLES